MKRVHVVIAGVVTVVGLAIMLTLLLWDNSSSEYKTYRNAMHEANLPALNEKAASRDAQDVCKHYAGKNFGERPSGR